MLIVLSGLSGVGKTTIARELARVIHAVHVRIDSIEQALRNAGWQVEGEGYSAAYAVAEDNLRLGRIVIADCVNPWPLTRTGWRSVADRAGVRALDVEIVCSDADEHRRRVELRDADSKILTTTRYGDAGPGPKGSLVATFLLDGQEFMALNGGPPFKFSIGMSIVIRCE